MSERSKVWHPLRTALQERDWDHQRIETSTALGVPDLNFIVPEGWEWWAELKYHDGPKRDSIRIGLRPEQRLWLRRGFTHGRNVVLIARVGKEWYLWFTDEAWELAVGSCRWSTLKGLGVACATPGEVLNTLRQRSQARLGWGIGT